MSKTYTYPDVALEGDTMVLSGGDAPEAILIVDWQDDHFDIKNAFLDFEEVPQSTIDIYFEFGSKKTANLVIQD